MGVNWEDARSVSGDQLGVESHRCPMFQREQEDASVDNMNGLAFTFDSAMCGLCSMSIIDFGIKTKFEVPSSRNHVR